MLVSLLILLFVWLQQFSVVFPFCTDGDSNDELRIKISLFSRWLMYFFRLLLLYDLLLLRIEMQVIFDLSHWSLAV